MAENLELQSVWSAALGTLADGQLSDSQRGFVNLAQPIGIVDSTALIAVPNDFTRDILETRLQPMLADALSEAMGRDIRLAVTVDPSMSVSSDELEILINEEQGERSEAPSEPAIRPGTGSPGTKIEDARLNAKYTFDSFVIGASNRFAHAAAVAVAEQPARAYNPLFIYGGSGLGKTHLLHAIGHYARTLYSGMRVRYVSSEEFTNEFINSIRDDKAAAFQRRYRDVDVLLVDDIQFLSGKVQTQEEFFHTFNTLHNSNKQIVVTSDLPPKLLQDFEDRMRSRFE